MDLNVKLNLVEGRGEKKRDKESEKHDQRSVGWLMYTALATRADISSAATALYRYNSRLFTRHMTAAKRALQYLKATAAFRLHFKGNGNGNSNGNYGVIGFTHSDWASDNTDHKSQRGHVFLTCHNGGAISWQYRKQDLITLSTLEAKNIACSEVPENRDACYNCRWVFLALCYGGILSPNNQYNIY